MPEGARRGRGWLWMMVWVIAGSTFLFGVSQLVGRWQKVSRLEERVVAQRTQGAVLRATQTALVFQLTQAVATEEVEAWAHQAGWVRPGERLVRPLWGSGTASPTPFLGEEEPSTPTPQPPPWVVWWGLFFGDAAEGNP